MKNYCLLVISLLLSQHVISQKKILFVGNSLLFYHNMPSDFNQLMLNEDDTVIVHQLTFSGYSLRNHLDNYHYSKKHPIDIVKLDKHKKKAQSIDFVKQHRYQELGFDMDRMKKVYKYDLDIDTINKSTLQLTLEKTHYDFIIIQEHGSMIINRNFRKYIASKSLERLKQILVDTDSEDTKLIYFTEYPNKFYYSKNYGNRKRQLIKKPYDTITCNQIVPKDSLILIHGGSFISDSTLIAHKAIEDIHNYEHGLQQLSDIKEFEVSATARIFHILRTKYPKWKLYDGGGHPSKISSFMFACVYYQLITGKPVDKVDFKGSLSEEKAQIIKKEVNLFLSQNKTNANKVYSK